jgi:hypothetical protein
MSKKKAPTLAALSAEVSALRAELASLKSAIKVQQAVKASVKGPRRSEVFVDAQIIPMSGQFERSGQRKDVELDPPEVAVDVVLKGQIGTATTVEIEINGKTKKEEFVTATEKEIKSFTYPFADFGL